jgi:hypothetical protein
LWLTIVAPACAYYIPGEFQTRAGAAERQRAYNIRFGRLQLDLIGRARASFDDNATASSASATREESLFLETGLDIGVYWPVSADLRLDATVYVGYLQVLSGDEGPEGWIARSKEGTALALDMRVGDNGLLSIVDSLQTNLGTRLVSAPVVGDSADLYQLENDFAVQYEHQLDRQTRLSLRLGIDTLRSINSVLEDRDRDSPYAAARLDWRPDRELTIFPYWRYIEHEYPLNQHNDAIEYEVGLGVTWQMNSRSRLELVSGYQVLNFDICNVPEAQEEFADWTGKAVFISQLSDRLNHALSVRYRQRMGNESTVNYNTDVSVAYRFDWSFHRRWNFGYFFNWIKTRESDVPAFNEKSIIHDFQLTYRKRRTMLVFAYTRTDASGEVDVLEFGRNEYTVSLTYDF